MDNQIILVSDEKGNFTGEYIPKEMGHTGLGKRHLAITVLIYNKKIVWKIKFRNILKFIQRRLNVKFAPKNVQ